MGVHPKWEDPRAFDMKVDEYFQTEKTPTWTGLAIYLGFESRQSLQDYKEKPDFAYSIKKALIRIENQYEKALLTKSPVGPIFALKNFGWKDKQEVEQSGETKQELTVKIIDGTQSGADIPKES